VVRGNPLLAHRTDRPEISTGRESQVSVQHAVAAALVKGQAGLDQFSDACVRDPDVLKQRSKVDLVRAAASLWDPHYDAAPLIDAIWSVEASKDVSRLVSMTAVG